MGFIYKITNTTNGKSYIGQTIQKPEYRINDHLNLNEKKCCALHNAIQKYGCDAFTVEILHEALDIFLDDLEVTEIKEHNTIVPHGYNLQSGGRSNKVVSDKTRQKMSESQKKRKRKPRTPETRRKISISLTGRKNKPHTPETRRKISAANKGKTRSLEARKKISDANKGRKGKTLSPEHRQKLSESLKGKRRSPEHCEKLSESLKGKTHSPEHRKKISESLKGRKRKPFSPEHRQKLSESAKRREYKPFSSEHRRKISEANAHPERAAAFQILNALPQDMPLDEIRKHLLEKFPEISKRAIYDWVKKWSETSP